MSVGAGYGSANSLLVRLIEEIGDQTGAGERVRGLSVSGSYNYYFNGFNRGLYTGGALDYGFYTVRTERVDEPADSSVVRFASLKVAPQFGYKIATEKGFTFSWDAGLGDQIGLGVMGGLAFVGSLNLGWSF